MGWAGEHVNVTLGKSGGDEEGFDFDGGLYLANGNTVTLASDGSIGWLGGNTNAASLTTGWNAIGGTITTDVEEGVTLTLNGDGKTSGNYTINENVKLFIDNSSNQQTFISSTIHGDIEINTNKTLAFEEAKNGDANTIESESELSGNGTLKVQSNGGSWAALIWKGTVNDFTGKLEFGTTGGGAAILELQADLEVGNLETQVNGVINGSDHTLKLNYTDEEHVGSAAQSQTLTLGEGVTLEKTGAGTFTLSNVTGEGGVKVSDGTLLVNGAGWEVDEVEVASGGILGAADGSDSDVKGTVKLTGGTLTRRSEATNNTFVSVNVASGGSKITTGDGNGVLTIQELTGDQALTIENANGTNKRVVVKTLKDYTGAITGTLNINGSIDMGDGKTGGTVEKLVVGDGHRLSMTGAGNFTATSLVLNGTLNMVRGGAGNLTVTTLSGLGKGATLSYAGTPTADNLIALKIDDIQTALNALGDGATLTLDVSGLELKLRNNFFCLGITGDGQGDANVLYHDLFTAVDDLASDQGGDFELRWGSSDGENETMLYLRMDFIEKGETEYDVNWGIVRDKENHRGPGKNKMDTYVKAYVGADGEEGVLDQLLAAEDDKQFFTDAVLSLAGTGSTGDVNKEENPFTEWNGEITAIRLTKGDENRTNTLLSVVGGSVFRDGDTPTKESRNSFIVLKVDDDNAEHASYHLLAGGSACVSENSGGSEAFVGFVGNTHLQVQGGTVDYLVGGNHVTNTFFGFQGDTFISVFDDNGSDNGVKSNVRGGIAGGSVITYSDEYGDSHYDFEGNTHIFIYTLLSTPSTRGEEEGNVLNPPKISDGTTEGGATGFAAVVGGNVWIDVPDGKGADNISPTFRGSTSIFVNLLDGEAIEDDTTLDANNGDGLNGKGTFDKAIVGGNYTVPKEPGENAESLTSNFIGTTEEGEYATHITIYAKDDHTFTGGINGASRRDSLGAGTTNFTGNTLVELHGGAYTNVVAGGMWFEAPTNTETSFHIGVFTGNSNVEIHDGTFFRVVGGNVSLESAQGSQDSFKGKSSVTIYGGFFGPTVDRDVTEQTEVPFVAGGSFYRSPDGTPDHMQRAGVADKVLTELKIYGGSFTDVHLVGGDYVNSYKKDSSADTRGSTIQGDTRVVIGWSEEEGDEQPDKQPDITGVVVGGSYLTDEGKGGKSTITGSTNVVINGGVIRAEVYGDDDTYHAHGRVAVVAGSMLIDSLDGEGESGGHTIEIQTDTNLTINGGTIDGFVVGGSYASDSKGTNTINLGGTVTINLKGGTIDGNIIGGHYSENTTNPDNLTLGDVKINVDGSTVHGLIFGGSFRRVNPDPGEALEVHPQQGDITINLTSGSVAGGVYAAGNHLNTGDYAELHVHTKSTAVHVTGDMVFTQYTGTTVSGKPTNYTQFVLSGGYQKNILAGHDIEDFSTVGYNEETGTWAEGAALLHFSNEGDDDSFGNLAQFSTNLILQDFDAVEVDEGLRVDLSGSVMRVMHKVAGVEEEDAPNYDVFIKQGKGDLILKGLSSWNAQKFNKTTGRVGTEEEYKGRIVIENGHLVLNGTGSQSLLGGLRFNMGKDHLVATGLEGDAYLQAQGGLKFSLAGASTKNKVTLKLDGIGEQNSLSEGIYRLASGVDWSSLFGKSMPDDTDFSDAVLEYFNVVDQKDGTLAHFFADGEATGLGSDIKKMFKFERGSDGESLVLRVYLWSEEDWVWSGENKDHIWDGSTHNFYRTGDETIETNATAFFFEGAYTEGDVRVRGDITVANINVQSGRFNFVADNDASKLTVETSLIIGPGGDALGEGVTVADRDKITASAGIGLDGENIPSIELNIGGQLVLNHEKALGDDTEIIMNGGTLAYGELTETQLVLANGALSHIKKPDYASTDGKNAVLRIQVGKSASDLASDPSSVAREDEYMVHEELRASDSGTMTDNPGIELGIRRGVIKSGRGVYEFEYTGKIEDENGGGKGSNSGKFDGTLRSREGRLEMVFSSENDSTVEIKANDEESFSGNRDRLLLLSAEDEKAELQLIARNGAKVQVLRGMTGNGTIIIGEDPEEGPDVTGRYTLATTGDELKAQNEGFTGTLDLKGDGTNSDVLVKGSTATLGNENSTLKLDGRAIVLDSDVTAATITVKEVQVAEGTTNYLGGYDTAGKGDADKAITLKAPVTGDGTLASAKGGFNHTIDGDMSNFNGTLIAGDSEVGTDGEDSTWTLRNSGASLTQENLELEFGIAGTGSVKVDYGLENDKLGKVYLKGVIGGDGGNNSVVLENAMDGAVLVIAGDKNTSTGNLVFNGNEIWLGDNGIEANWTGNSLSGENGSFVLRNGTLKNALTNKGGVALKVDTAKSEQGLVTVNVGDTTGSQFDEITINEGGRLRGVNGDITVGSGEGETKVKLVFSKDSLGNVQGAGKASDYLIGSTGGLVITEVSPTAIELKEGQYYDDSDPSFVIDFSNEALLKIIMDHRDADIATYLRALSGGTITFEGDAKDALDQLMRTGKYSKLLGDVGFTLDAVGGDFILRGSSADIYLVLSEKNDPDFKQSDPRDVDTAEEAGRLAEKKATLLDEGTTLTLDLGEGKAGTDMTVNNLVGLSGSTVNATGDGTVTLKNSLADPDPMEDDKWLEDVVGKVEPQGRDTEFDGKLKGESGVTYKKTGEGTLTVGDGTEKGGLDIEGTLQLENGDLVVRGADSHLGTLNFAYGTDSTTAEGLVVDGGKLSVGDITEGEENSDGNRVTLKHGGVFEFTGGKETAKELDSTTFSGSGTLSVADGSKLTLGKEDGGQLDDVGVELADDSELDIGKGNNTVSELNGTGTLKSDGGDDGSASNLTVSGGTFSGTLGRSQEDGKAGKLTVADNGNFTLKNAKSAEGTTRDPDNGNAWDVELGSGSQLTVDVSGSSDALVLGDVDLGNGNLTVDFGDGSMKENMLEADLSASGSGTLEFHSNGKVSNNRGLDTGFDVTDEDLKGSIDQRVKFTGAGNFLKDNSVYVDENNNLWVRTTDAQQNKLERALPHANKNALAGAGMLWDSLKSKSQLESFFDTLDDPNSDYKRLINAVIDQYDNNQVAELECTLTAVSGASISTLGPALVEDLHRQLKAIRNRTTTMGSEEIFDVYDEWPIWNMWINAENGYHRLDADGYLPGYTLNSWGGTLGVNLDVSKRTTVGLALTAMYGDLKTEAADTAKGDLDTFYLSGFARTMRGAWSHTFVVSGGLADIRLDRTVNYAGGSYRTHGSTEGYAFGALYEVGYTRLLNKKGTVALQPVANIEVRHVQVNGYTETGSDAGLKVDDIDQTVFTLGMGARMQAVVGHNTFNRDAIIEGRALVKADFGDRSGTAMNGLIGSAVRREVESAEVGAVGLEVGAGITVPLGSRFGSVFMDASFEYRQGWMSVNASAGYKITF